VNLPHVPGDYTQRYFGIASAGDDRASYRRNLVLVDQLIGEAQSVLAQRARYQDILVIVSSDHWHRINSPLIAKRIPWIAWHVGETDGISLNAPISTVHTAALIESFLDGKLNQQAQIAQWWSGKPFYPPLMPHGYSYQ
jgi:hypothetical protein